jgi:hypothetical protein
VPTFFASLIIAGDPAAYGFSISDAVDPDVKRVEVEGPLSLRFLEEKAHVGEGLLRELNPMLRRGVVPAREMEIRVPSGSARVMGQSRGSTIPMSRSSSRVSGRAIAKLAMASARSPEECDANLVAALRPGHHP